MGYIELKTGQVALRPSISSDKPLSELSWAKIASMCRAGNVPWAIGDTKTLTLTNGITTTMVLAGKNHDTLADGSGNAGATFISLRGINVRSKVVNAKGGIPSQFGWEESFLRNTTMPQILALLPNDVKSKIRIVQKQTAKPTSETDKTAIIGTTNDSIFVPSYFEIFGTNINTSTITTPLTLDGEGTQYEYFANALIPEGFSQITTGTFGGNGNSFTNRLGETETTRHGTYLGEISLIPYNYNSCMAYGENNLGNDSEASSIWWTRSAALSSGKIAEGYVQVWKSGRYVESGDDVEPIIFAFCL